jgi:hypothetical protein
MSKYFCQKCQLWTEHDIRPISIILVLTCGACQSEWPVLLQQSSPVAENTDTVGNSEKIDTG